MPYLFAAFRGNGEDGLYLSWSRDGYLWTPLNGDRPMLRPCVGESRLMRDPSLALGPDGTFHLVWTTAWSGKTLGHASSNDLIHWSEQRAVGVMLHEPHAENVWAPELFHDRRKAEWLLLWSTTITGRFPDEADMSHHNHRIYASTTKDFETFTPARLFFEPGFNVIDAALLEAGGRYYLFVKDERLKPAKKHLFIAESDRVEGPYHEISEPITGDWVEGPSPIKIGDDYFCYFDRYRDNVYGAIVSRDLKHWTDVTDRVRFPQGYRHGSCVEVSKAVLERLLSL
jgi:beta-xylosidase